jgi:hypothetical protein
VELLPRILQSFSEAEIAQMQEAVGQVWHRFMYSSLPLFQETVRKSRALYRSQAVEHRVPTSLPKPYYGDIVGDDAFSTSIQWLHSRINATR